MTAPILVRCLVALREEFDELAPTRDRGADGWIGDAAHQQESSDHNPDESGRTPYEDSDAINEVHALDVDRDLRGGLELGLYVERIRRAHQAGADDRLQNIIWQGRIASRSWGWSWRPYTGASQHYDHAHFSARYATRQENDTSSWGVRPPPREWDETMTRDELKTAMREVLSVETAPYVSGPGNRIRAAEWKNVSRDAKIDYLCELVMTEPDQSVMRRLTRLEEMLEEIRSAVTAPPPAE